MNCEWAAALTRYDCRPVHGTNGEPCLEIGTPFSLPDGSAINIYLREEGSHVRVSDNADTVFQLGGMGLDMWHAGRIGTLRDLALRNKLHLAETGELYLLTRNEHAAAGVAITITGLLAVSLWAAERLEMPAPDADLAAELQPYIVARNPAAEFEMHPRIKGASRTMHVFDMRHGNDLIDVISAHPNATGAAMRKAGDVQNGPFAGNASPLIIVDDRKDAERAASEIGILGSVTRAMPVSALLRLRH